MIWILASLIAGIALRAWSVFILPLAYIIGRRNRDLGLLTYFLYGVLLVREVFVRDLISEEAFVSLGLLVPSVLALREIGEEFRVDVRGLVGLGVMSLGFIYKPALVLGVIITGISSIPWIELSILTLLFLVSYVAREHQELVVVGFVLVMSILLAKPIERREMRVKSGRGF
ncbi:hypothetical protein [Pyrococcus horikoshii]|uniref:Uncharacterized protein n=2 Tax=Pyrococcus horikoshii TaxID=53953 RepID=O58125_PYRHO|nr:hypothetical protein [Pyrococcus horikoshii]BAA29463.1 171aa long hypothetical protein [Pyrococcus horikoshii OT3]HII61039.1 hypothetical protein [Pyrococcus horikoshii]